MKNFNHLNDEQNKELQRAAAVFMAAADLLNEEVSAYIDGDQSPAAEAAYEQVRHYDALFVKRYNKYLGSYYGDNIQPGLNYEHACWILDAGNSYDEKLSGGFA